MKILYIANIRLPTEKAHGAQIMKTCEALSERGAEVELMIPGRRTHIEEDPFSYYNVRKNFRLTTVWIPDLIRWEKFGFVLSALMFSERVKLQKQFRTADVIYSRDAFVLLQYLLVRRQLVYEAHMKPTLISTALAHRAYRIVVISEGLKRAYEERGISPKRLIVARDAIDLKPFEIRYDKRKMREWLGIPQDKKIILYVGRIDKAKGVDTFAEAESGVPADTIFVAIGSGPLKDELTKKCPNVLFLPETKYSVLPRVLVAADVLVVPNSAEDVTASAYTSPMKAFAYLAAGKPIVAADVPSLREIFGADSACYFVPDNPANLRRKVEYVLGNETYADMLVHEARRRVRQHSWGNRADIILRSVA